LTFVPDTLNEPVSAIYDRCADETEEAPEKQDDATHWNSIVTAIAASIHRGEMLAPLALLRTFNGSTESRPA
jgi:hypothetical protein